MGSVVRVYAVDLNRLRPLLGSGEEAFCAKVLRGIPEAAQLRGLAKDPDLVKEWKRTVTGLVLGAAGDARASCRPFEKSPVTRAGPGLSLAFASVLEGFSEPGLGGLLAGDVPAELRQHPLFGLEADGDLVRWGAIGRDAKASEPLIASILAKGLDAVGLS